MICIAWDIITKEVVTIRLTAEDTIADSKAHCVKTGHAVRIHDLTNHEELMGYVHPLSKGGSDGRRVARFVSLSVKDLWSSYIGFRLQAIGALDKYLKMKWCIE